MRNLILTPSVAVFTGVEFVDVGVAVELLMH
jgi:hypothetical protein